MTTIDQVRGFAFPFRIDPATGGVQAASGLDKIRQNLRLIIGTRIGERPLMRQFGTRIPSLVHEPNDSVLADVIQTQARDALIQWEPRVLVTGSHIEQSEGELRLRLAYILTTEPAGGQMTIPLT
jgi:phage baseplate assembly protein W